MPVSQLSQIGIGTRRSGSFAGKQTVQIAPVTRLAQFGIGTRRYNNFADKETAPSTIEPIDVFAPGRGANWDQVRRRKRRSDEKLRAILERLYTGIRATDDPVLIDTLAEVIHPFTPVNADELPPASQVDWEALLAEPPATRGQVVNTIKLLDVRINAAGRLTDDDEIAITVLLL